jgi:hypothetical protein
LHSIVVQICIHDKFKLKASHMLTSSRTSTFKSCTYTVVLPVTAQIYAVDCTYIAHHSAVAASKYCASGVHTLLDHTQPL